MKNNKLVRIMEEINVCKFDSYSMNSKIRIYFIDSYSISGFSGGELFFSISFSPFVPKGRRKDKECPTGWRIGLASSVELKCLVIIINASLLILITALFFNMNPEYILYALPFVPVKTYTNADTLKDLIIQENKEKSGVYRWRHLITGKSYVGSSINLGRRFRDYYNYNFITHVKNKNMYIYRSILKHGYSHFKLEILEYCTVEDIRAREQYYLDLLNPEYNLLQTAGSSLGFKHSEESLAKMRKHLDKLNAEKGFKVEVLDTKTNSIAVYDSARQAAKAIGCDKDTILYQEKRLAKGNLEAPLLKKRYTIKIIR